MAIDATAMGANSNSYVSVEDADSYFADRLGAAAWDSISDEIITISSATISGVYSLLDNETTVTISGFVAPTPSLSIGEVVQISTDLVGVDGSHFIKRVLSDTSFQIVVSGDQSLVSTLSYLDRSKSDKPKALIMATRYLDQLMYKGERKTLTQKLAFPRMYLPDPDASALYWGQAIRLRFDYLSDTEIPDRITYATCELALRLLGDPELAGDPSVRQFRSVSIDGVLSVVFNENSLPRVLDRNILNYISPLLENGSTIAVAMKR